MNVDYILTVHGIGGRRKSKDDIPPPPVVGFKATANGDNIDLTWQNPDDTDFVGVRIVKNVNAYPTSEADGDVIYDGIGLTVTDAGVPKGQYIYYRAFTYDFNGNIQTDGSQIARGAVKTDQVAPAAPTVESLTSTSVTLKALAGHEYSRGGSVWQSHNIFDGLRPDTSYVFYQRKAGTGILNPSPVSEGLTVTTSWAPYDDPFWAPGPKNLVAGNMTQGYFGETSTAELISGTDLASMIGLSEGIAQFDSEPWLKFMLDGKVLFVAKKPYRHSISWDAINAVDAVYGGKEISIGDNKYKVRLLKTSLTDPCEFEGDTLHGGEWNRLMLPIHEDAQGGTWSSSYNVGPNDVPNDWGIGYTDAQLITHWTAGDGSASWMQETLDTDATMRLIRGYVDVSVSFEIPSTLADPPLGWRPCLEVVS